MNRLTTYGLALAVALGALTADTASAQRPIPINIESTPPGATVYFNVIDESKRIGVTPLTNVRIPRGSHVLIFRKEMHEETRLTVNVRRRRETFRATLTAQSTISISGTNTPAQGAAVRIDGEPVGNVPHMETVTPGRHLVQVGREGYVTFSQWVQVAGAQGVQVSVNLEEEAPETGSLLVAGDTTGAAIYIDGEPRGTTPSVLEGIPAGEHTVKVQADDPNMEVFEQRVRIIAGERVTLNPTLRPAPAAVGSIRVLVRPASAEGAVVSLDGEVIGEAPASKENVTPGEHIIEVRADGFEGAQQPVTIESGTQRVISVELTPVQAAMGRIVVNANVAGASVTIDGEDKGAPPIVVEEPSAGTHAIVVRAPGYQELRHTCTTGPGQSCELVADMDPVGSRVTVEANTDNAEFVVDGEVMGRVPWEGTIPVGYHDIEIRAEGYRSYHARLEFTEEPRLINEGLTPEGEMTAEERAEEEADMRRRHRQSVARSGAPLDPDVAVLDFSIGWPYLLELRMGIGILDWLDAGIGIRTMFRLTEFEGRVKAGFRPVKQVSLGIMGRIGGGIGVGRDDPLTIDESGDVLDPMDRTAGAPMGDGLVEQSTNSFFFSLEALFTLHFLRAGNFTLWGALDYHSDSWAWNGSNNNCRYTLGCQPDTSGDLDHAPDPDPDTAENTVIGSRQSLARFRLGGSLEFIIARHWNMWVSFEGTFGGDRRIVGDLWGANRSDINAYARLGFTYKFGYGDEPY